MNLNIKNSKILQLLSWKMPVFFFKSFLVMQQLNFLFNHKKAYFIKNTSSAEFFFYNYNSLSTSDFIKGNFSLSPLKKHNFSKLSKYKIMGFRFFNSNFLNLKIILFNAFYYNFFLVGLKESSFLKDLISINYNSVYFDYTDVLGFFKLKSWISVQRYWKYKLYSNPSAVLLAADNHLLNHLNKSHFFIIDFLSNSINITSNSFTVYVDMRDSFFSSFFFNFVYRYKIIGLNFRFFKYLLFFSLKKLTI